MRNSKKGISLIVLVITIVVIIILAAAVILSLNNNNLITNARRAVNENDFSETNSAFAIALQDVVITQLDNVVLSGYAAAAGFTGAGYSGETPTSKVSTLSADTVEAASAITIEKLGLPATFKYVAIKDNKVTGIVKNTQLYAKDTDGVVRVLNANFDDVKTDEFVALYESTWFTYGDTIAP